MNDEYVISNISLMIDIIFQEYLKQLDQYIDRPVVLLIDNASNHN